MPKSRSVKSKGTYEWIHTSIDLPPVGIRPSRAGNNDTGAKGKLKCVGCRLSKIKLCVYDYANVEAACSNCIRRGMSCGVKLPGPKTRTGPSGSGQDRDPEKLKEYVRLFEKFQRIRPDDSPGEIENLIELVENGILKEEGNSFVVRGSEDSESDDSDWESSSHNATTIPNSEFEGGYLSIVGLSGCSMSDAIKLECAMPSQCVPREEPSPFQLMQNSLNASGGFREFNYPCTFTVPFPDDLIMLSYS